MNRTWPIPAPDFVKISGKRRPPSAWGDELFCQIRTGIVGQEPWPVETTRWIHDGTAGDVVAVRKVEGI